MNDLTTEQLRRLLAIQSQIDRLKNEKASIMGGKAPAPKRVISAAAKKKISASVRKRWAERKAKGEKRL